MNYKIKEIEYDDIEDYMNVNITSWQESYKGIVDDEFLDEINNNRDKYIKKQQDKYYEDKKDLEKKFILIVDNKVVGMTSIGQTRDPKHPECGEIYSIYLSNEVKGKGLGKILFLNNIKELINLGFNDIVIGCLSKNPSNEFYKHMGGELIDTYKRKIGNQELDENVYYFSNIKELIKE